VFGNSRSLVSRTKPRQGRSASAGQPTRTGAKRPCRCRVVTSPRSAFSRVILLPYVRSYYSWRPCGCVRQDFSSNRSSQPYWAPSHHQAYPFGENRCASVDIRRMSSLTADGLGSCISGGPSVRRGISSRLSDLSLSINWVSHIHRTARWDARHLTHHAEVSRQPRQRCAYRSAPFCHFSPGRRT
jgi:hypothetical protein